MLMHTKQHLRNIWSSIHKKVKQHWGWTEKKRYLKKSLFPAVNYMFKVNNRNTKTRCEIFSYLIYSVKNYNVQDPVNVFAFSHNLFSPKSSIMDIWEGSRHAPDKHIYKAENYLLPVWITDDVWCSVGFCVVSLFCEIDWHEAISSTFKWKSRLL